MFKMLMLFVALFTSVCFASGAAAQTAERPDVKLGDLWTYSRTDTRYGQPPCTYSRLVREVDEKPVLIVDNPKNCQVGVNPVGLEFPLEIGKTWHRKYSSVSGSVKQESDATYTVVGVEKIAVPAGTFDAFKIIASINYTIMGTVMMASTGTTTVTMWYSPQVRKSVKITARSAFSSPWVGPTSGLVITELVRYQLAARATQAETGQTQPTIQ
jgi:hypothetical protein